MHREQRQPSVRLASDRRNQGRNTSCFDLHSSNSRYFVVEMQYPNDGPSIQHGQTACLYVPIPYPLTPWQCAPPIQDTLWSIPLCTHGSSQPVNPPSHNDAAASAAPAALNRRLLVHRISTLCIHSMYLAQPKGEIIGQQARTLPGPKPFSRAGGTYSNRQTSSPRTSPQTA